jgi:hypothetical protein
MSIRNPNSPTNRSRAPGKIILRSEIEEAQRHTNSNAAAARWLNVNYGRYRKYAQLYGIFERHLNPAGFGVDKGASKRPTSIPLKEILEGKHPKYSLAKLKNRLIARKKLIEKCSLCGFDERRITDKRVPLMLTFKDDDRTNFQLNNLALLCYNCMFLTTGAPSVVNRNLIERSFTNPESIPKIQSRPMVTADYYDPTEDAEALHNISLELTEEERQTLYNED